MDQSGSPGSTQGRNVKIGNVLFRFINSRGGKIGPSEFDQYGRERLYEAFIPDRRSLGMCPPLESNDKRRPLGGSYGNGGRVFLRQSDPLPITITDIIPEVFVGGPISGSSH